MFTNRDSICKDTAKQFANLARMRGVTATIAWDAERAVYTANGESCGTSVHGLYEWLDKQPGVQPQR